MIRAASALALATALVAQEHAAISVTARPATCYRHQPVTVVVHVEIDDAFLRDSVIQPFRRRLDVPVSVTAPWLDGLERAIVLDDEDQTPAESAVVNGALGSLRQTGSGFELTRRVLFRDAGPVTLSAATLHLQYATEFRDDFVLGRVPVDRHELTVHAEPVTLDVRDWPAGAPVHFTGAVGRFSIRAAVESGPTEVGPAFGLGVRISGDCLEFVQPPPLEFDDFHEFGRITRDEPGARTFVYDLAALRIVERVPPVHFAYFEPGSGYHTVSSAPVAIDVRPLSDPSKLEALVRDKVEARRPQAGVDDIHTTIASAPQRVSSVIRWTALATPWLLALLTFGWCRARRRYDPWARRVRRAAAAFARGDLDLIGYLATRLHCSEAAVIAPDLGARLRATGVDPALADEASAAIDALHAERFGGDVRVTGRFEELVARLERSFGGRP